MTAAVLTVLTADCYDILQPATGTDLLDIKPKDEYLDDEALLTAELRLAYCLGAPLSDFLKGWKSKARLQFTYLRRRCREPEV